MLNKKLEIELRLKSCPGVSLNATVHYLDRKSSTAITDHARYYLTLCITNAQAMHQLPLTQLSLLAATYHIILLRQLIFSIRSDLQSYVIMLDGSWEGFNRALYGRALPYRTQSQVCKLRVKRSP